MTWKICSDGLLLASQAINFLNQLCEIYHVSTNRPTPTYQNNPPACKATPTWITKTPQPPPSRLYWKRSQAPPTKWGGWKLCWSSVGLSVNSFPLKDHQPLHFLSLILYRFKCDACNSIYIGNKLARSGHTQGEIERERERVCVRERGERERESESESEWKSGRDNHIFAVIC